MQENRLPIQASFANQCPTVLRVPRGRQGLWPRVAGRSLWQQGLMEGPAPADGCGDGHGWSGRRDPGGRPSDGGACSAGGGTGAAAAYGNGAAAGGVVTSVRGGILVPAAARHWFPHGGSGAERSHVTVHGRRADGTVRPFDMTLLQTAGRCRRWMLSGLVDLAQDLGLHTGDKVQLTQEAVAAGGGMGVVVEKVEADQQQQQQQEGQQGQGQRRRRRRVRTVIPAGKSQAGAAGEETSLT